MAVEFLDRFNRHHYLHFIRSSLGFNLAQPYGFDLSPYAFSFSCACFPSALGLIYAFWGKYVF